MIIEICRLSPDGERFEGEESADILGIENDPFVRAQGPLSYDLFAQIVSRQLVVRGAVSATLEFECSRCTDFFSTTLKDSSFLRAYDLSEHTETVDLATDIREAVLLRFPSHPVCGEECKGLCAHCGKSLNKGPCGCVPPKLDDKWQGLDELEL